MHQPLMADGSALFQLQEEMRNAFECLVIDLPRTMMVHHPHLLADVQSVVAVTALSLAGTRDTIRLLAWLRPNAQAAQITVVANAVAPGPASDVSRRDFEAYLARPPPP